MNFAQTVLLPVDMQQAFDGPSWPSRWNGAVDRNGQAILGAWRSRGLPIIHVKHDSRSWLDPEAGPTRQCLPLRLRAP